MEWATVAALILQYGLPFAEFLFNKIQQKGQPTPDEWAQLKLLAGVSARAELVARLQANGVDPASDKGKALLALVS